MNACLESLVESYPKMASRTICTIAIKSIDSKKKANKFREHEIKSQNSFQYFTNISLCFIIVDKKILSSLSTKKKSPPKTQLIILLTFPPPEIMISPCP